MAIGDPATSQTPDTPPRPREGSHRPLQSGAVYAFAAALQRAIGFLLLPLYTRALDPADYGALSVLTSVAAAVAILFTFGLDIAIFRTYFEYENNAARQGRYIQSIWRVLVGAPLVGAVVLALLASPFVGEGRVSDLDVLLAFVGMALWAAATTVPLSVLRAQQRLRDYLKVSAVSIVATPLLTVLFVVVLDTGITGWFVALVLSMGLSLLASMWILPWERRAHFDSAIVRKSLAFSLPLVPHALSHWALQLADRSILILLVSSSAVGVYTLAANLALPVMIAVQSLNLGFMPTYAQAAWKHRLGHNN